MLLFCKFKTTFYCKFSSFFWMTFTNLHLCYYRIPPLWSYRYARLCILSSSLQMKESTLSWSWNCVLGSAIFGWRLLLIYIHILTLFSKSLTSFFHQTIEYLSLWNRQKYSFPRRKCIRRSNGNYELYINM